jgi:hypothetical protein
VPIILRSAAVKQPHGFFSSFFRRKPKKKDKGENMSTKHEGRIAELEEFVDNTKGILQTLFYGSITFLGMACGGVAFVLNLYLKPITIQLQTLNTTLVTLNTEMKELRESHNSNGNRITTLEIKIKNVEDQIKRLEKYD